MSNIKDASLWQSGRDKIEWVRSYMPLLTSIEEEFKAKCAEAYNNIQTIKENETITFENIF